MTNLYRCKGIIPQHRRGKRCFLGAVPASHHTLLRWTLYSCLFPAWKLWPPAPPPSSFFLIPIPFKHKQKHYLWRVLISNASIMPGKTLTIYLMSTDMMIHKRWFQSKWASLICCEPWEDFIPTNLLRSPDILVWVWLRCGPSTLPLLTSLLT